MACSDYYFRIITASLPRYPDDTVAARSNAVYSTRIDTIWPDIDGTRENTCAQREGSEIVRFYLKTTRALCKCSKHFRAIFPINFVAVNVQTAE